ncbi:DUF1796 family putative cysteine peptidase [Colwellia sp. 12G3]|uniref:DUF1796 family putative cysteine peptidase n=1 Tax=Colwellia sp. 12G3 TaxID=2058299 RepID=UPI0012FF2CC7|nr:DUF1796 family putative cysteine peptidase [Colwellia sp. 12G3]
MKYDTIIPIGANCRVAQALRDLKLRQAAFPLDWTLNSAQAVLALFKSDFDNFFSSASCQEKVTTSQKGKNYPWVLNTQYQIGLMHEHHWSEERVITYQNRINALQQSLNADRVLLIRWDMKAPFHNDPTHAEHEKRDTDFFEQEDSIAHCYALKDLCNEKYSGKIDLLIFHADEIKEQDKRPDVCYHHIDFSTAKTKGKVKEWDRTAIKEALIALDIQLENPITELSRFAKMRSYFSR